HALPTKNAEFNTGQPIKGMKTDHLFTAAEQMVPFKCDVHGGMNAYAGVMSHPFFATTGDDGTFTIKGLPPGTYKLAAWHEKLGKQTADVTLAAKDEKENNFTCDAGARAGAGGAPQMGARPRVFHLGAPESARPARWSHCDVVHPARDTRGARRASGDRFLPRSGDCPGGAPAS